MLGIHITLDQFSKEKRIAVEKATAISNQIKALLQSGEVVTLEKITGTEALGEGALKLLDGFIKLINSAALDNIEQLTDSLLSGIGSNLSAFYHDGEVLVHGISEWIHTFETIYHLLKKK
jgi:uncharacterized protein YdgA (DUF945 family)